MDEKQQVLMEMAWDRFGSEAFQKSAVEALEGEARIARALTTDVEIDGQSVPVPLVEGQVKDEPSIDTIQKAWMAVAVDESRLEDDLSVEEIAERLEGVTKQIQANLTKSVIEGENPKVIEGTARDPEPAALPEPVRRRCDVQKAKPRKVTNREKRRERHARRAAHRR